MPPEPVSAEVPAYDLYPLQPRMDNPARVPRRFGVGVMMLLTAMFAVAFASMNMLGARPETFALFGILLLGVVIGQIVLFRGERPRLASVLVGAVLFPVVVLVTELVEGTYAPKDSVLIVLSSFGGVICGYLAGGVAAGMFFVLDYLNGTHKRALTRPALEIKPFTADDIPTLLEWTALPRLAHRWTVPEANMVDRDSLQARVRDVASPTADWLLLKAIDAESGQMLGFCELVQIDKANRSARLTRPIVLPTTELDRHLLSVRFLRAVLRHAFAVLHLHRLALVIYETDYRADECFRRVGFSHDGLLREARLVGGMYTSPVLLSILDYEWRWGSKPAKEATPKAEAISEESIAPTVEQPPAK